MLVPVWFFPWTLAAAPEPRSLSAVERRAAVLAADYLRAGSEAWWPELAESSPFRQLGEDVACDEIEVRAGAAGDAVWRLRTAPTSAADRAVFTIELPSGFVETLTLHLVEEDGTWKIHDLRIEAEAMAADARAAAEASAVGARGSPAGLGSLAVAVLLLWSALTIVFFARGRRAMTAAALLALSLGLACSVSESGDEARPVDDPLEAPSAATFSRSLRELLPLRRDLAMEGGGSALALPPELSPVAARAGSLWRARLDLQGENFEAVEEALATFEADSDIPLVHLLRARIALARLEPSDSVLAYNRAVDVSLAHDGLLYEAGRAFFVLGFQDRAREYFRRLEELGTREAEVYYDMARLAVYEGRELEATEHLLAGWRMAPKERSDLLGDPALGYLIDGSETVKRHLELGRATEPRPGCFTTGAPPAAFEGAEARLLGGLLTLSLSGGELQIPGGCALAPANSRRFDGRSWQRLEDERALADLPRMKRLASSFGALRNPSLQHRVEKAAEALASRRRWREVLEITEWLTPAQVASVPSMLIQLRVEALRRASRLGEASNLLVALLRRDQDAGRGNPAALYQLADLLVLEEQYDLAIRAISNADRRLPFVYNQRRIRQIQIEKRLATLHQRRETAHFILVYPLDRSSYFADKVEEIFELEFRRLQRFIPVAEWRKVEVYLLPFEDFRNLYSRELEVLGIFDGRIRLPFADVPELFPELIDIISHELAHAMIAQATADRAPRWLQEGLAQHVEPMGLDVNPIDEYVRQGRLIALPMLEGVLSGQSAPRMVAAAYDESLWALHFIESRYGVPAIHRLLRAFADGLSNEEAIQQALGKPLDELDVELWKWCLEEAPASWPLTDVKYQELWAGT